MKQLNVLQSFFNKTAQKAKYLLIALVTALLIVFLFQLGSTNLANQTSPKKATFDPSYPMRNGEVQIDTNAFRGIVRVYPNGGTPEKTPQEHPVLTGSSTVRDQLWVAGGSTKSWAHFQFWGEEVYQKPRVDPLLQAGTNQTPTRYTFPCKMLVGTGVVGWGLTKVGGGACERIEFGSSRYISGDAGSSLVEKYKVKGVSEEGTLTQDVSDPYQFTISRSEDLTLAYVYDLDGDIAVDILVGSVQINSFGSINAGTRYLKSTETTQTIDPSEIAKSPSVQTFLNEENWSPELATLIGKFNSSISPPPPPLTKEQQEILDAHNRWRSQVNVPPLRWSKKLADRAQAWADNPAAQAGGGLVHSSGGPSGAGENMAASSDSVTEMVNMWGREGRDYDYTTNSCRGDACGHYTQVVWGNTTELGCGVAPHRIYGRLLVCNYSPPGNFNGERPY